jgi:hypothetical protein
MSNLTTAELQDYRREFERLGITLSWTSNFVLLTATDGSKTLITHGGACDGLLKRELEKARDRQGGV